MRVAINEKPDSNNSHIKVCSSSKIGLAHFYYTPLLPQNLNISLLQVNKHFYLALISGVTLCHLIRSADMAASNNLLRHLLWWLLVLSLLR